MYIHTTRSYLVLVCTGYPLPSDVVLVLDAHGSGEGYRTVLFMYLYLLLVRTVGAVCMLLEVMDGWVGAVLYLEKQKGVGMDGAMACLSAAGMLCALLMSLASQVRRVHGQRSASA